MRQTFLAIQFAVIMLFFASHVNAQLANGHSKFFGNILKGLKDNPMTADPDFLTYWNQATPENAGKHGLYETDRDVYQWQALDEMYAYCQANNIPFKQHTFLFWCCGADADWLLDLSDAEIRTEMEEWIIHFFNRYPNTAYVEVVNEPFQSPPPAKIKNALGGDTDYAWVRWVYEKARQHAPASCELWINENNVLKGGGRVNSYKNLINFLKADGNIDAVGMQGHWLEGVAASTIQNTLDQMDDVGLPLYITEYEVHISNDNDQRDVWAAQFPVMWEHPAVQGVTLWGYKQGQMWRSNGYLVRSDGSERPSMTWIKSYLGSDPDDGEIKKKVITSTDDAEQLSDNSISLTSGDLDFGQNPYSGMRFTGINIPQVANITNAYIQFTADKSSQSATSNLTIKGQDTNDAGTFTSTASDLSSRTRTSASVSWSVSAWNTAGQRGNAQKTPEIKNIIQEIVDRSGWQSGNDMVLFVEGTSGKRSAKTFNGSASNAPELVIEFEEVSSSGSTIKVFAAGKANTERMNLQINGNTVKTWNNIGGHASAASYVTYTYEHSSSVNASQIRILFDNDASGKDLRVDKIEVDGTTYQTEASSTYSTGTWKSADACGPGYKQSEWLHCNGYFAYENCSNCRTASNLKQTLKIGLSEDETFNIYPNPVVNNQLFINISVLQTQEVTGALYDLAGKEVARKTFYLNEGINKLNWGVNGLKRGMYIFNLDAIENHFEQKLLLE